MNYSDIILNIREAKTPFEILDSVDNLKWLLEREKYRNRINKQSKPKQLTKIDNILKHRDLIIKCVKS